MRKTFLKKICSSFLVFLMLLSPSVASPRVSPVCLAPVSGAYALANDNEMLRLAELMILMARQMKEKDDDEQNKKELKSLLDELETLKKEQNIQEIELFPNDWKSLDDLLITKYVFLLQEDAGKNFLFVIDVAKEKSEIVVRKKHFPNPFPEDKKSIDKWFENLALTSNKTEKFKNDVINVLYVLSLKVALKDGEKIESDLALQIKKFIESPHPKIRDGGVWNLGEWIEKHPEQATAANLALILPLVGDDNLDRARMHPLNADVPKNVFRVAHLFKEKDPSAFTVTNLALILPFLNSIDQNVRNVAAYMVPLFISDEDIYETLFAYGNANTSEIIDLTRSDLVQAIIETYFNTESNEKEKRQLLMMLLNTLNTECALQLQKAESQKNQLPNSSA